MSTRIAAARKTLEADKARIRTAYTTDAMVEDGNKSPCVKLSIADLVLSVLPWPFHKDLPSGYCGENSKNTFWDLVLFALPWPFHRNLPLDSGRDGGEEINEK